MQSKTYIPSPFAANSLAQSECRGGDPAQIFFCVWMHKDLDSSRVSI